MNPKPFLYGKYVILDRIAVGGMAEVFRAKTFGVHGFQRLLVIKRILPHLSKDEEFIDMFVDEAKIAVSLTHANICQVTDLGKIDDNYFIAMEFVNGKDLRAILKKCYANRESLNVEQAIYITSEVCKGLEYAHRREEPATGQPMTVIHRDISPQNIMISYHAEVKIVDFGIAKTEFKIHRTQAGVLKGKFAYMSPEQSMGQELTTQTDIFSLGIILYEMLTNTRLFLGATDFETLENIKKCEIPSIREKNPRVSMELEKVVLKILAKEPADRYATAGLAQNALSKILYTEFPDFTQDDLTKRLSSLFETEIKKENENLKKTLELVDEQQVDLAQRASEQEISQSSASASRRFKLIPRKTNWFQKLKYPLLFVIVFLSAFTIGKLFFGEKSVEAEKVAEPTQKNFRFETQPPGCEISMNGETKGQTPIDLTLPLNQHFKMTLKKRGYQTLERDVLTDVNQTHMVFSLKSATAIFGAVKIDTSPSGAEVYLNGENSNQTTPTMIDELPLGKEAEISIQKEGYKTVRKKLMISQTMQDLRVELERTGPILKINPVPSDAKIYLDNEPRGKITTDLVQNHEYELRVEAKGYVTETRKIKIEGDQLELDIDLKKPEAQTGDISISATPWATVLIDGKIVGTSPILNYNLAAGKHEILFRHPNFPDVRKNVNIKVNESQKLIIDLRQESNR